MKRLLKVLLLISLYCSTYCCPKECVCKWRSGKESAECINKDLTAIPSDFNSGTQVLDLGDNKFHVLTNSVFQEKGLTNLQKIFLSGCHIREIERDAFYHLTNLIELDLSRNYISEFTKNFLQHIPNLRRLRLNSNPITNLTEGLFENIPSLTHLDLSDCRIRTIHEDAFKGLKQLEKLKLESNLITTLSVNTLQEMPKLFGLDLSNNPWKCDCTLKDLRQWMGDNNIPLNIPPRCEDSKKLSGLHWDQFTLDDLVCSPKMHPTINDAHVLSGSNVTFSCEAWGVPEPEIHWLINDKTVFLNKSSDNYIIETERSGDNIKTSHLNILHPTIAFSGLYTCHASNSAGSITREFNLTIAEIVAPVESVNESNLIYIIIIGVVAFLILIIAAFIIIQHFRSTPNSGAKHQETKIIHHISNGHDNSIEKGSINMDGSTIIFEKAPKHENGSSGYGSDHPTPDLVSRTETNPAYIPNMGPQSGYIYSHESAIIPENQYPTTEHWNLVEAKPLALQHNFHEDSNMNGYHTDSYHKYEEGEVEPPLHLYDPQYNMAPIDYSMHEIGLPQNDRVQNLRAYEAYSDSSSSQDQYPPNYKRSPMMAPHEHPFPHHTRFSPDEGYVEALEGTEV